MERYLYTPQKAIAKLKQLLPDENQVIIGGRRNGKELELAIHTGIKALEKQLNDRWIPVSERLPGDEEINKLNYSHPNHRKFLCTIQIASYKPQIRLLYFGVMGWLYEGENYDDYVIAWKPLPEPYKGE